MLNMYSYMRKYYMYVHTHTVNIYTHTHVCIYKYIHVGDLKKRCTLIKPVHTAEY